MDDYSKTGPKTPKAAAALRARITAEQMRILLELSDESIVLRALQEQYGVGPSHPNFEKIMQIWQDSQKRRF